MSLPLKDLFQRLSSSTDPIIRQLLEKIVEYLTESEEWRTQISGLLQFKDAFFAHNHDVPLVRVYNTGVPAAHIPASGGTAVLTFNTPRYNNHLMWEAAVNPTRITARESGWYCIGAHIEWDDNSTGSRILALRVNGATFIGIVEYQAAPVPRFTRQSVSSLYYLAREEYVEAVAVQFSGGVLQINATLNFSPEFWAFQVLRDSDPAGTRNG